MPMSILPADLTTELLVETQSFTDLALGPSELEVEIISLFDQFRNQLLRYVLSFGLPAYEAEEVIQEVFLALFRHLQRGKSRSNLRGWIFRVAHNLGLKQAQVNRRVQETIELSEAIAATHVDPSPNPEEQAAGNQRQGRLQRILRTLPPKDQRCLYLRAEGLRYREISEVLDMSLGAVSISLAKSLARLGRADGA